MEMSPITLAKDSRVLQDVGLVDRVLRLVIGAALMGSAYYLANPIELPLPRWGHAFAFGIALYPIFTGMLGRDPFYAMFNAKTCGDTGKNQCGSLSYQVKAMSGHVPKFCVRMWNAASRPAMTKLKIILVIRYGMLIRSFKYTRMTMSGLVYNRLYMTKRAGGER
jgi:hypothetical protein